MKRWERARNYIGETYYEYFVLIGQHRDSDALDRSNFQVALDLLSGESEKVLVVCSNHWAVGWIEGIFIHESATDKIAIGEEIEERLSQYPVLDEEHYSELELSELSEYWENASLRERVELCGGAKVTFFAARHDDAYWQYDALYDYLRQD